MESVLPAQPVPTIMHRTSDKDAHSGTRHYIYVDLNSLQSINLDQYPPHLYLYYHRKNAASLRAFVEIYGLKVLRTSKERPFFEGLY